MDNYMWEKLIFSRNYDKNCIEPHMKHLHDSLVEIGIEAKHMLFGVSLTL